MSETKIGQIGLSEKSNRAIDWYRVPGPGQGSENPDPVTQ